MDGWLNFVIKQMNKHKVVLIVFKTLKDSLLEVLCGKPFTEKYPQTCKETTKIKCLFKCLFNFFTLKYITFSTSFYAMKHKL